MSSYKLIEDKRANRKSYIIECDCGTFEHQMGFSWWQDKEYPEVYFHIFLHDRPFWRRVITGIKYIFGYKSRYGDVTELVLTKDDIKNIKTICEEAEKDLSEIL